MVGRDINSNKEETDVANIQSEEPAEEEYSDAPLETFLDECELREMELKALLERRPL